MSGTATVTAPIGPAVTATAVVFTGVQAVNFDPIGCTLSVTLSNGQVRIFDTRATTTITATASSGVFTFTVSQ